MNWYVTGWQHARGGYVAKVDQQVQGEFYWVAWLVGDTFVRSGMARDEFAAKSAALAAIDDHERSLT